MTTQFLILFSMIFWLAGCLQDQANYGNVTSSSSCAVHSSSKWGGVTCLSGTDQDQNFLDFLSNGTDIDPSSEKKGVGDIKCTPGNNGGFLIRMTVVLNGPFDPNGQNNSLIMQPAHSTFEFIIHDLLTATKNTDPISAKFQGVKGEVNGNQADLTFVYRGGKGEKTVTLRGTFDTNLFTGAISFENEQYWDGRTPGASGQLGEFKIATCSVFQSQ